MAGQNSNSGAMWILIILGVGFVFAVLGVVVLIGGMAAARAIKRSPTPVPPSATATAATRSAGSRPAAGPEIAAARARLVGRWIASPRHGGIETLDLNQDGSVRETINTPGEGVRTISGSWQVMAASGETVRIRRTTNLGVSSDQDIQFTSDKTFLMLGERGGEPYRRF